MTQAPQTIVAPIDVFVTNRKAKIVERAKVADLDALVRYLVATGAEYTGRLGFVVRRNGEDCLMHFSLCKEGAGYFQRKYIEEVIYPRFVRYKRVDDACRLRKPTTYSRSFLRRAATK